MGSTSRPSFSNQKPTFIPLFLLLLCLTLTLLIHTTTYDLHPDDRPITSTTLRFVPMKPPRPRWYDKLQSLMNNHSRKLHLGLVNVQSDEIRVDGSADLTEITFEKVGRDTKWKDLFPEWVDEDHKWGPMKCPEIPMGRWSGAVDVVVAKVPEGGREVGRLQVNLVVANVLVNDGWEDGGEVYVVFIGRSGPMWEIFRCDDMVWEEGEYKIYKPDLKKLMEKVNMPVGSCIINPSPSLQPAGTTDARSTSIAYKPREAYVTVLHSSETYVCGAIALAQSILQTNTTKDLILLADDSISDKALGGLKTAGWKIKLIERIRSPHARKGAYNEYNYSKLRIWQLIEYDKVMFIDADLIVLKNLDEFFSYPQISAAGNNKYLFNSGVILVEPSLCMFNGLMEKINTLGSYNGGDQGFLNEAFTWWHRFHSKINHLKIFQDKSNNPRHEIAGDLHTIHYLGLKPWMCYKDYDCNWDRGDHRHFASDLAHEKWWKVYQGMPNKLRPFCGLTKQMDSRIRKWRGIAKRAGFPDEHWKIKVKDTRQISHGIML
ncbi:putative UDP-glucuronate:xylan alpha-glucuronosyltransferase 5 [Cynara cardunculus var. scolymus]|uniref:putative UDP-glucuronate:xylan alpha-glucuronosyltransferase 5 n=1 Tax=Cynara cardunculus var. scolymus TaxID=59895 RepID=UPI000D62E2BF|nr:putative UDP-glucuronate:xylan alpha-glucuronosyltransferase 5 [Cynara cardunculus var. scolymus]